MAVFVCPGCAHTQDAPDEYLGRTAKCLKCETKGPITKDKPKKEEPPAIKVAAPVVASNVTDTKLVDPKQSTSSISNTQGSAIVVLLSGMLAAQLFGLTSTKSSTTQWEYTIESPGDTSFESATNRLGRAGWELVFARRATSEFGSPSYEMIFKRPKR